MTEVWRNWARTQRCECDIVRPKSLDDLRAAVKAAAEQRRPLRAAGRGYSWSPLVPSAGTIVSTRALDRLIDDRESGVLEVECGMTIETLDRLAAERGYTLVSPTLFPEPTVGGVVAVGGHGSDSARGSFSDQIREMRIVRWDGSLHTVRRGDPEFPAALVALGTLGIVYSVKLEVVPQYNVYVDRRYVPVHYVLQELEDLRKSCDFLEIFWFPLQGKMWLYVMNRTDSQADPETWWSRLRTRVDTWLESTVAGTWIPQIARRAHRFTPILNRVASRLANSVEVSVQTASAAFHHQKAYPKAFDLCYAVPAHEAANAWSRAIALVDQYARAHLHPVNLAFHCRFVGGSDAWLAPNHGRPTCYIEAATARRTPHWDSFAAELEARWLAIAGARPHWAKLFSGSRELFSRYPRMNDFLNVRQRWDPERVFLNRFLEQDVFQLPPRPAARAADFRGVSPRP